MHTDAMGRVPSTSTDAIWRAPCHPDRLTDQGVADFPCIGLGAADHHRLRRTQLPWQVVGLWGRSPAGAGLRGFQLPNHVPIAGFPSQASGW